MKKSTFRTQLRVKLGEYYDEVFNRMGKTEELINQHEQMNEYTEISDTETEKESQRKETIAHELIKYYNTKNKQSINKYKFNKYTDCSICLTSYQVGQNITEFGTCNHSFHEECITKWISEKNSCPICRKKIL